MLLKYFSRDTQSYFFSCRGHWADPGASGLGRRSRVVLAVPWLLHMLPEDVAHGVQVQRGSRGLSNLEKEGDADTRYLPQGCCSKQNKPVTGEKIPRDSTYEVPGREGWLPGAGEGMGSQCLMGDRVSV